MANKSEITNSYKNECIKKYVHKKELPFKRKIALFGYSKNNIAETICDHIVTSNYLNRVYKFSHKILDLNSKSIKNFHWESFDTFIFNQGKTNLNWIENESDSMIEKIINTNLTSNIKCLSHIVRKTIDNNYIKTIIFIGSMGSEKPLSGSIAYTASKAGLSMLVKNAAFELAPKGFRVFGINPSAVIDTPMTNKIIKQLAKFKNISIDEATEYWKSDCLIDKYLTKDEIGKLVLFLMREDAKYLSGNMINLSGGQR